MKAVVHKNFETGGICLLMPNLACGLTIEQIAEKDAVHIVRDAFGDIVSCTKLDYVIVDCSVLDGKDFDKLKWSDVYNSNDGTFALPADCPCKEDITTPSSAKVLADALVSKGVITQAEIDVVAAENGVKFSEK